MLRLVKSLDIVQHMLFIGQIYSLVQTNYYLVGSNLLLSQVHVYEWVFELINK
jgi:hypothetical protein